MSQAEAAEVESPAPEARGARRRPPWTHAAVAAGLVVLAIVLAYVRSGNTEVVSQAVVTGILVGGVYGLVAMGLTLIFGVLDIVNFAHGAFLTVALYITVGFFILTAIVWFAFEKRRFQGPPIGDLIARRQDLIQAAERAVGEAR